MTSTIRHRACIVVLAAAVAGCAGPLDTALDNLMRARSLSADLLVQFTKSVDAANRTVMANSEESSGAFAREAGEMMQTVQRDADALAPVLVSLRYTEETRLLTEFGVCFAEYRTLSQDILGLAVDNSNLKAQRLSFGAGQQAADEFRNALEQLTRSATGGDRWRVQALVAAAIAEVREIQVVQAPHIAEADDAAMNAMEKRMATAEGTARDAVKTLATVTPAASRPRLTEATAALDRFMAVNAELVVLSRRNSNVRSLALSLGQKRILAAKCDETLRALQAALAARGFGGSR